MTDFIKSVPLGGDLILTNRMLTLLKTCSIMPFELFDVVLIHRNKRYSNTHQLLLHWESDLSDDMIDFSQSRFFITILDKKTGQELKRPAKITSIRQMKNIEAINEPDRIIYAPSHETIVLSDNFDFEVFHLFHRLGILVTQKVKDKLEHADISGVRFVEREDITFTSMH